MQDTDFMKVYTLSYKFYLLEQSTQLLVDLNTSAIKSLKFLPNLEIIIIKLVRCCQ